MAPRGRQSANDADTSMADAPDATTPQPVDDMVRFASMHALLVRGMSSLADRDSPQDVDETPDYTDSDTNPNTSASSVVGEPITDGRKKRSEANQLRKSIFGKKHDRLGESKVGNIHRASARMHNHGQMAHWPPGR